MDWYAVFGAAFWVVVLLGVVIRLAWGALCVYYRLTEPPEGYGPDGRADGANREGGGTDDHLLRTSSTRD